MICLTKDDVVEIKKKIKVQEIDETILKEKGWINIKEMNIKVGRTPYEELLLFQYSIDFLRKIDCNKIRSLLDGVKDIVEKANNLLTDYNRGQKYRLEVFGADLVNNNRMIIHFLIGLVFEELLDESEGIDEFNQPSY